MLIQIQASISGVDMQINAIKCFRLSQDIAAKAASLVRFQVYHNNVDKEKRMDEQLLYSGHATFRQPT